MAHFLNSYWKVEMTPKKSIYVYLTGGLGNQLFQLSSALRCREDMSHPIILDSVLGSPRATDGVVDIAEFYLPENVSLFQKKASIVMRKAPGFLLRMGISPRGIEKNPLIKKLIVFMGRTLLSFRYKRWISIAIANNVGESSINVKRNTMLIGYFQTHTNLTSPNVRSSLEEVRPKVISEKLVSLISRAILEEPIFVHFRFQDYLQESNFGIPGEDYYSRSLNESNARSRAIWVFSDNIDLAKKKIPSQLLNRCFFLDDSHLSPAQILHLFRHGYGYVIANSTFSWWGAALTLNKSAQVFAPEPWFKAMDEPKGLISSDWIRKAASFD